MLLKVDDRLNLTVWFNESSGIFSCSKDSIDFELGLIDSGLVFMRRFPGLPISKFNCNKITAYTHPQIDLINSKEIAISYLSFHPYCSL